MKRLREPRSHWLQPGTYPELGRQTEPWRSAVGLASAPAPPAPADEAQGRLNTEPRTLHTASLLLNEQIFPRGHVHTDHRPTVSTYTKCHVFKSENVTKMH